MSISLQRNVFWALCGSVGYAASQWLLIVVVAKTGSPSMVGQFTLALSICTPIVLFSGLALRVVQANDVQRSYTPAQYFGLRLATTSASLVVLLGVAALGPFAAEMRLVLICYALTKAFESMSEMVWGHLQQQEQLGLVARCTLVRGFSGVVAAGFVLAMSKSLVAGTFALAIASVVTLLVHDLPLVRRNLHGALAIRVTRASVEPLARTAFPLGIVLVLSALAGHIPRYLLASSHGDYELGIYGALVNLVIVGNVVTTGLGQAVMPRLARHYARGQRSEFVRVFATSMALACAVGLIGCALVATIGGPVLRILYTPVYADLELMLVLMGGGLFMFITNILGVAVAAAGEYTRPVPLQAVNVGATLVLSAMIVPAHGAIGAAWVVLVSGALTTLLFSWLVRSSISRIPAPRDN